jgi:hypothetical protein
MEIADLGLLEGIPAPEIPHSPSSSSETFLAAQTSTASFLLQNPTSSRHSLKFKSSPSNFVRLIKCDWGFNSADSYAKGSAFMVFPSSAWI